MNEHANKQNQGGDIGKHSVTYPHLNTDIVILNMLAC